MTTTDTLLVVEDDPRLGPIMRDVLTRDWHVTLVTSLTQARAELGARLFDVAIVDRRLPDGDGIELIAWLRDHAIGMPTLLLTALGETADKVEGLDAGAHDYLVKPFDFDELNARLRALARLNAAPQSAVTIGNWTLYPARRMIESPYAGLIDLTPKESALLHTLAAAPDTVFSRAQLLSAVFDANDKAGTVDTYVHYVRRKTDESIIHTIRGIGYQIGRHI